VSAADDTADDLWTDALTNSQARTTEDWFKAGVVAGLRRGWPEGYDQGREDQAENYGWGVDEPTPNPYDEATP
jgi:hypothetical protein